MMVSKDDRKLRCRCKYRHLLYRDTF